jgi:hypothetical protein
MKRILGTVVAIAGVLAFSTLASAAPYSFNVSGSGAAVTVSTVATVPCGGGTPGNCFTTPFSAGSSINLDITGGVATITSGTLEIDSVTNIFGGAIVVTTDVTATISGGLGTLSGDDILWTSPASYTTVGTFSCTGSCGAAGLPTGGPFPISALFAANTSVNPVGLGTWDLDASLSNILGSTRAVTSFTTATGIRASWLLFGPSDLGHIVPEPGSAALVLLGLGALALRARKA